MRTDSSRIIDRSRIAILVCLVSFLSVFGGWGCSKETVISPELKIGLLEEPKSLNIWRRSDAWSSRILSLIYQPLYIRDPETLDFVPWLAAEHPIYDEASLSYRITLRAAKWSDGSPLTSADVAFTASVIQEFRIPRYYSDWDFIKRIETPDDRTVVFYLDGPRATFATRSLTMPIVSKKEWDHVIAALKGTESPLIGLLNHKIEAPISNGPFMLVEWKQGAYLHLRRNDLFFGKGKTIQGRLLGPYLDGIIFKLFGTSDIAILALKKGDIDMFWWGIQPGYREGLEKAGNIRLYSNEKSALYYLGLNVRKPPLNDVDFRRAIATVIDKDFILARLLQGQGVKMNAIVPPGNRYWHRPDMSFYGDGLPREDRIKQAYRILKAAGYGWKVPPVNDSGEVVRGKKIKDPEGNPIPSITILTPPADYDPMRAQAGIFIQEWLRALGIPARAKPVAFSSLSEQVQVRRQFDAFIHGYGNLSLDPDYVRRFFHSKYDKVRGRNTSGYHNVEFDRIADESALTMDREKRRDLIWQMQRIISRDVPWIPLYNPHIIEAVRTGRFSGWVDMPVGIGNWWSFCLLKPVP